MDIAEYSINQINWSYHRISFMHLFLINIFVHFNSKFVASAFNDSGSVWQNSGIFSIYKTLYSSLPGLVYTLKALENILWSKMIDFNPFILSRFQTFMWENTSFIIT